MLISKSSIGITCPICNSLQKPYISQSLKAVKGLNIKKFLINDEEYKLVWFVCKNCGEWLFVQADNDHTEHISNVSMGALRNIKDGIGDKRGQKATYTRLQLDLARTRKQLELKLTGKQVYDDWTGSMHSIQFVDLGTSPGTKNDF